MDTLFWIGCMALLVVWSWQAALTITLTALFVVCGVLYFWLGVLVLLFFWDRRKV